MAEFALMAGQVGTQVMAGIEKYKAGRKEHELYGRRAFELERGARITEELGIEKQRAIERRKRAEVGHIRSAAAGKGLRVAGSVQTLSQRVAEDFERDKLFTGIETTERARGLRFQAGVLRKQARRAKRQGYYGAGTSLLQAGTTFGQYGYEHDWFRGTGSSGYASGYSATATPGAGRF